MSQELTSAPGISPEPRRRGAVEAFCHGLCPAGEAESAVTEALAGETAAHLTDRELLARTRRIAAYHASPPVSRVGWRGRLAAERDADCRLVPHRLAARAEGDLTVVDQQDLEDHVHGCPNCQELERRFGVAEAAFTWALSDEAAAGGELPLEAMAHAAPVAAAATLPPVAATPPPVARRDSRARPHVAAVPIAALALVLALLLTGAVALMSGGSSHHTAAPVSVPTASAVSITTPVLTPAPPRPAHHARRRPPRAHRRAHKRPAPVHSAPAATLVVSSTTATSATPVGSGYTAPASSSGGSGSGGGSASGGGSSGGGGGGGGGGSTVVVQGGGSLSGSSAPSQGIGGSGTGGSGGGSGSRRH